MYTWQTEVYEIVYSYDHSSLTPMSHPVLKTTWSLNQIAFKAIDIMSLRQLAVHIVRPLNVHVSILHCRSTLFLLWAISNWGTATCIAFTYLDILFILVLYHWHQQGNAPTNHVLVSSYGETRWKRYLNFTFNSLPRIIIIFLSTFYYLK